MKKYNIRSEGWIAHQLDGLAAGMVHAVPYYANSRLVNWARSRVQGMAERLAFALIRDRFKGRSMPEIIHCTPEITKGGREVEVKIEWPRYETFKLVPRIPSTVLNPIRKVKAFRVDTRTMTVSYD